MPFLDYSSVYVSPSPRLSTAAAAGASLSARALAERALSRRRRQHAKPAAQRADVTAVALAGGTFAFLGFLHLSNSFTNGVSQAMKS